MIESEDDLWAHLAADNRDQAIRHVYKYTDCGAWIEFHADGVRIGSIVEGCDFGTTIYELKYPFASTTYNRCIAAIEAEATALWDWANAEEPDGADAPDVELDFPELEPYRSGRSA